MIDLLFKNGHLIDPASGIDRVCNLGIRDGKSLGAVTGVSAQAQNIIDASGYYIFPGLVDFHTHIYTGNNALALHPDLLLSSGVTCAVDAGSAGRSNFEDFYNGVVKPSMIRVYSYLNIRNEGMPIGENAKVCLPSRQDTRGLSLLMERYPDQIKGLKVYMGEETLGTLGLHLLEETIRIADDLACPVVVHASNPPSTESSLCGLLRKGDVMCHCYHGKGRSILHADGKIEEGVLAARKRGVLFDCSNGFTNYNHSVTRQAIQQGFFPDIISTDITSVVYNKEGYCRSLPQLMSKYLDYGMTLSEVVRCTTETPAKQLGIFGHYGTLAEGAAGDVTICKLVRAAPVYLDNCQQEMTGTQLLIPVMTVLNGKIVYRYGEF
ncbi:hypothetical protein DWV16_02800 [Anaerotruncus sp. AF02-27]|uniref:amidohydrolase family protein n=1 Tax=Anaerotruncus TaxID=244127 RepID=UPI000E4F2E4D|nr:MULTISPECIES: amidohydrolase family protein [Anaerotruncus]RGX56561.1 hypothetical protein DWV16_02800 [Anaerotruncus sp. AF02-27]